MNPIQRNYCFICRKQFKRGRKHKFGSHTCFPIEGLVSGKGLLIPSVGLVRTRIVSSDFIHGGIVAIGSSNRPEETGFFWDIYISQDGEFWDSLGKDIDWYCMDSFRSLGLHSYGFLRRSELTHMVMVQEKILRQGVDFKEHKWYDWADPRFASSEDLALDMASIALAKLTLNS